MTFNTLRRRTPLRRGQRNSSYSRRERDTPYMLFCKRLACSVRVDPPDPNTKPTPCYGPVQADHLGMRGLGRKAEDRTCAPMCWKHHGERTDHNGTFKDVPREVERDWKLRQVARTLADFEEVAS